MSTFTCKDQFSIHRTSALAFDRGPVHHFSPPYVFRHVPEHLNANRFIDATEEISGPLESQHYKRFAEMATLLPGGWATVRGFKEPYGPRVVSGELQCEAGYDLSALSQPVTVTLKGSIRWGLVFLRGKCRAWTKVDPVLVEEGQLFSDRPLKTRWFCYCRSCRCMTRVITDGHRIRNPGMFRKRRAHLLCSLH